MLISFSAFSVRCLPMFIGDWYRYAASIIYAFGEKEGGSLLPTAHYCLFHIILSGILISSDLLVNG